MKKFGVIFLPTMAIIYSQFAGCAGEAQNGVDKAKALTALHFTQFGNYLKDTLLPLVQRKSSTDSLQKSFLQTRLLYKRTEWATEYFMAHTTRLVNGPPVPEIETEENKITEPEGLQVVEALLFSKVDTINYSELQRQTRLLVAHSNHYQKYWNDLPIDSAQIFDALRLEVFRILTLGISGFDAPLVKSSLKEAAVSLETVQELAEVFDNAKKLSPLFEKAKTYLLSGKNFDDFDRLNFISNYSDPLTKGMVALQQELRLPFVRDNRLLRSSAASLFGPNAFDVNAYTQDSSYWLTPAKVELGKALFYDAVLSQNNTRSCATCHQPGKAFTDGLTTSVAIGTNTIRRNAPTLLNAALQPAMFYDMRTTNLENQSRDVIHNKTEMHGDLTAALKEIRGDTQYQSLLKKAFPKTDLFTERHLQNALASYVRSLAMLNSRFDKYMRNEDGASFSNEERKGFNLFMGKAKCGTCHFMPLFNGTVPPAFLKMESEVIGVPANKAGSRIDSDSGRYALHNLAPLLYAFKTTTVRNTARTAPYMHNGVFNTLEEVVDFYDRGGGAGLRLQIPNQTLPSEKLNLSLQEKQCLIAFLQTLDDEK